MKRIYNTEEGFFRGYLSNYCSIEQFFGQGLLVYDKKHNLISKVPSDKLKAMVADRFVERHFVWRTVADKERIKKALVDQRCDLSYFQFFYTNGSNSLSGEAYDYCKRKFIKSIY